MWQVCNVKKEDKVKVFQQRPCLRQWPALSRQLSIYKTLLQHPPLSLPPNSSPSAPSVRLPPRQLVGGSQYLPSGQYSDRVYGSGQLVKTSAETCTVYHKSSNLAREIMCWRCKLQQNWTNEPVASSSKVSLCPLFTILCDDILSEQFSGCVKYSTPLLYQNTPDTR